MTVFKNIPTNVVQLKIYLFRNDEGFLSVTRESLELSLYCESVSKLAQNYIRIRWGSIIVLLLIAINFIRNTIIQRTENREIEISQMMKETIDILQNNAAR
jgi:hypothetical protein